MCKSLTLMERCLKTRLWKRRLVLLKRVRTKKEVSYALWLNVGKRQTRNEELCIIRIGFLSMRRVMPRPSNCVKSLRPRQIVTLLPSLNAVEKRVVNNRTHIYNAQYCVCSCKFAYCNRG